MIVLDILPKNKQTFLRLVDFLGEVIDICNLLDVEPVLSGSLAVFAFTKNQALSVHDIDLACLEKDFSRIIEVLQENEVEFRLKEWHVLQVWKEGLKIEFDSMEHWMNDISTDYETLQLENITLKMVNAVDLRELYRRGLTDTADQSNENHETKHNTLRRKYEMLNKALKS